MPSPGFARELATESERWAADGLLTEAQADALRARYPLHSNPPEEEGGASQTLYGTAGILLGAAAIALVFVGLDIDPDLIGLPLVALGAVFLAAGVTLRLTMAKRHMLGDALLVAGLVPLTAAAFPDNTYVLGWLGVAAALGLLAWRRDAGFVQPLAVIAFTVSLAGASFKAFEEEGATLWLVGQVLLLAALAGAGRAGLTRPHSVANALATIAVVPAIIAYSFSLTSMDSSEAVELTIGAAMLGAMTIGIALKDRGMLLGAATALAIDAIVFAFDFGGVFTGTIVLVAIAALLIFQAEALKRFFRAPPGSA